MQQTGSLGDRIAIKLLVLEDLGLRSHDSTKPWGAYFIHVQQDEMAELQLHFLNNLPRIDLSSSKNGDFNQLAMEDGAPVDKVTKKAAAVYGFQNMSVKAGQAQVEVVESFGMMGITIHTYDLTQRAGKWVITKHSQKALS